MASRKLFYVYPQQETDMSENEENVFEFDESDIHNLGDHQSPSSFEAKRSISISRLRRKPNKTGDSNRKTSKNGSLPVNIPDWSKILKSEYRSHVVPDYDSDEDEEDDDEYGETGDGGGGGGGGRRMIPPHEYLARRRGSSFTVHDEINGTSKERDLRILRNVIWEKIGFLD